MKGSLSLSQNPVMHLTDDEFNRCKEDFDVVEQRMEETDHRFYDEMMYSVMRTLILDFFDFHVRINDMEESSTSQGAHLMGRFISMLERGDYRTRREVSPFAFMT